MSVQHLPIAFSQSDLICWIELFSFTFLMNKSFPLCLILLCNSRRVGLVGWLAARCVCMCCVSLCVPWNCAWFDFDTIRYWDGRVRPNTRPKVDSTHRWEDVGRKQTRARTLDVQCTLCAPHYICINRHNFRIASWKSSIKLNLWICNRFFARQREYEVHRKRKSEHKSARPRAYTHITTDLTWASNSIEKYFTIV